MSDTRLVLPYDVEGVLIETIDRRHAEHLAKLERQRGAASRTYEGFKTVVRVADAASVRLSGDMVPACLLGVIGLPAFARNAENGFDATYQVGMQVTAMGNKRRETILARDVLAWTTAECLIQRTRRDSDGLVHSIQMVDYEPLSETDTQRTLADARMIFTVQVVNVMTLMGVPAEGRDWPAFAGGAPDSPYDPLEPLPTAQTVTFDIDQPPLAE